MSLAEYLLLHLNSLTVLSPEERFHRVLVRHIPVQLSRQTGDLYARQATSLDVGEPGEISVTVEGNAVARHKPRAVKTCQEVQREGYALKRKTLREITSITHKLKLRDDLDLTRGCCLSEKSLGGDN